MSVHQSHSHNEKIAALAHKFWEDEGRPEGRAEIHWQRAMAELAAAPKKAAAPKATAAAKTAKPAANKAAKTKA